MNDKIAPFLIFLTLGLLIASPFLIPAVYKKLTQRFKSMSDETKCKLIFLESILLIASPVLALYFFKMLGHLLGDK